MGVVETFITTCKEEGGGRERREGEGVEGTEKVRRMKRKERKGEGTDTNEGNKEMIIEKEVVHDTEFKYVT